MYQEEIFTNAITTAHGEQFDNLADEVQGMELALEKFFTKIFESTASLSERDFNIANL